MSRITLPRTCLAVTLAAAITITAASCSAPATNTTTAPHTAATSSAQTHNEQPPAVDPHTLTGVTHVVAPSEVTPVAQNPTPALPVTLVDADGHTVTVTDTSRIIALDLFGTYTKTLRGLGLEKNIVGRSVSSDEKSLAGVPVVTPGGHSINVEAVLGLHPSLVIVDHSIGPATAIDQIRDAGVTVVVMNPGHTIGSVGKDIINLANVVGLHDEGQQLARRSVDEIIAAKKRIATMLPKKPLTAAFIYARGTGSVFYILGKDSGAFDLINGIGAVDVAHTHDLPKAAPIGAESLPALNPDVFFMMDKGLESTGGIDGLLRRPGVAQTTAGQHRRVIAIPDADALSFGPQSGEMLLRVAEAAYGQQHGDGVEKTEPASPTSDTTTAAAK